MTIDIEDDRNTGANDLSKGGLHLDDQGSGNAATHFTKRN